MGNKKNLSYYSGSRNEISPMLPKKYSKILEIGCGTGNFRDNFTNKNEYWGVEPNELSAEEAKKKLDKVLIGTYSENEDKIPKDYFDLIICNDVIEHMLDPDLFLLNIKKHMTAHSYLVASIPNVRYIDNLFNLIIKKDWKYKDAGILDRTHFRFFTEKSFKRTIEKNGFKIESFKRLNPYRRSYLFKKPILKLLTFLLGQEDIMYRQFAVRIYISSF